MKTRTVHCNDVTTHHFSRIRFALPGILLCVGAVAAKCQQQGCPTGPANIVIADGSYAPAPHVSFHLKHFHATLQPLGPTSPLCFQKLTIVSQAEIFINNESLTEVFTAKLENSSTKIRNFKVKQDPGGVTLSGVLPKLIPIHFSLHGPVTTDGSTIMMQATSMKANGIPVKGLMSLLGAHLNDVFKLQGVGGIEVKDDQLSFSPEKVAHLRGHLSAVLSSDAGLTLVYGPQRRTARAARRQH